MSKPVVYLVTVAFTMIAGVLCANATTINFSSLSQPGSTFVSEGNSYTQQGFTFTDQLNSGFGNGFAVWEASSPNLPGLASADASLFELFAGSTTVLTDAGGAPFDLDAIDLTQYFADSPSTFNVTFTGTLADSSTVSQTFTVDGSSSTPVLQTVDFTGFDNVVSVSFTQGTADIGTAYQFDNVVVDQAAGAPEPGTFGLMGLCLAVAVLAIQRQRYQRASARNSVARLTR